MPSLSTPFLQSPKILTPFLPLPNSSSLQRPYGSSLTSTSSVNDRDPRPRPQLFVTHSSPSLSFILLRSSFLSVLRDSHCRYRYSLLKLMWGLIVDNFELVNFCDN
ncbi:hypothetical protein ACFE04_003568 [Oxalis oulophora]